MENPLKLDVSCHEMSSSISSQSCQHILLQSSFFPAVSHSVNVKWMAQTHCFLNGCF